MAFAWSASVISGNMNMTDPLGRQSNAVGNMFFFKIGMERIIHAGNCRRERTGSLRDLYSRITYPILMRLYARDYPND